MKKNPEQTSSLWENIKFSIKHEPNGSGHGSGGIIVPQKRFHNRWATHSTLVTSKQPLPVASPVPTVPSNRLRHIKNGKISIEKKLDLHGKTVKQATSALDCFFHNALQSNLRTVMVITGKGSGKLQQCLFAWAEGKPFVLSVHVAAQKHGGSGAYYIFLRRNR